MTTPNPIGLQIAFAACGLLLLGLIFVVIGLLGARSGQGSQRWPSVEGQVLDSKVAWDPLRGREVAQVRYRYQVKGVEYRSSRVSFRASLTLLGLAGPSVEDDPAREVARYPAGKVVTVYHSPSDPSQATLEPGKGGGGLLAMAIGGMFFALGLAAWVLALVF